jgi:hypothetical protein
MPLTISQKSCGCCAGGGINPGFTRVFFRRFLAMAEWALPAAIFALLPKCPLCLVAYTALGTGIGISVSTATYLRTSLFAIGVMLMLFLAARLLYRLNKLW